MVRSLVWLSRLHRCGGFGIQSPTDYAFAREVISERLPYYGYKQLDNTAATNLQRKMGRLCLRLANWRQPLLMPHNDYERWCQAGCRRTLFCNMPEVIEMAVADICETERMDEIISRCNSQSLLVADRIYKNRPLWETICQKPEVTVVFDLYYCGIAMFDPKRYKTKYTINF